MRKSFSQLSLIIFTDFHHFTVNEDKLQHQSIWRFLLRSWNAILVKIWKWLKLLNSVPFIKKTGGNHFYNWVWSFGLTFAVLQWMKTNFKIVNLKISANPSVWFWSKIWKWLRLLNSVPFIKETGRNHVYNWFWSFCLTFALLQWMKVNFKISRFEDFC